MTLYDEDLPKKKNVISIYKHQNKMSLSKVHRYREFEFDVMVLHDENDRHSRNEIVPRIRSTELRCSTIDECERPGKMLVDVFEELLTNSRKILFILSKHYAEDPEFKLLSGLAMKHRYGDIITLITDGVLIDRLKSTTVIFENSENWWNHMISEINMVIPDYCQLLDSRKASDLLFIRGLCLINFTSDIYGLLIVARDKVLKLNIEEYFKHRKLHKEYRTSEICSQCSWLNHINTAVSLVMNIGCLTHCDHKVLKYDIIQLFIAVLNTESPISTPTSYRSLTLSCNGEYSLDLQDFISGLYRETRYELLNDHTRKQVVPTFPEFSSQQQRRDTYPDSWHSDKPQMVENLCKAGFYYIGLENNVQCFFCGFCIFIKAFQEMNPDPFETHSKMRPSCNYIKSKMEISEDKVDRSFLHRKPKTIIKALDTVEERRKTFHKMDSKENDFGITDKDEREKLAKCLAEAGFYSFGHNTVIGCFCCGISLAFDAAVKDRDPWIIHATLSSRCEFLLYQKGIDFIQTVQKSIEIATSKQTVVTFKWTVFENGQRANTSELVFRPSSKIALNIKK